MVSLVSSETWGTPNNITSTAQISLKVPATGFEIGEIVNLHSDVIFELNGLHESPDEAPEYDYISFGLQTMGTEGLHYQAGETINLFTFKNIGECNGPVFLLKDEDPFSPPNSKNANVGNQITIFGAQGDAYSGINGTGEADCSKLTSTNEAELNASLNVYPNPVEENVNVSFDWVDAGQSGVLVIYDALGKNVVSKEVGLEKGHNRYQFDVDDFMAGTYSLELQTETTKLVLGQFVKL